MGRGDWGGGRRFNLKLENNRHNYTVCKSEIIIQEFFKGRKTSSTAEHSHYDKVLRLARTMKKKVDHMH